MPEFIDVDPGELHLPPTRPQGARPDKSMKTQQRADLVEVISELCRHYPHWRFGQLVANVAGWADQEIWDVEDEQLLETARLHLTQLTPPAPLASREVNG
jgi:hypothetical protein